MMDLVLRKNVEEKTMNSPFILGTTFKKYLALTEKVDYLRERQTIQQLDSLIQLIVEAFDKQFTVDDFCAGPIRFSFEEKLVQFCLLAEGIPLDKSFSSKKFEATEEIETDAIPSDMDSTAE